MKKILFYITILLFAVPSYLFGQDGWIKEFPGPGDERVRNMINTSDGNYVFTLSADEGLGNNFGIGSYLVKLDINGDILWMHQFLPYALSITNHIFIIETNDNGFLISIKKEYNGILQPFFIKLDADGNEEWSQSFLWGNTVTASNNIHDFIQIADGNYLISGSDLDFGSPIAYVSKFDPNLNEIWSYQTESSFSGSNIKELPGGDIIAGGLNGKIVKLDPLGNEIWLKEIADASAVPTTISLISPLQDGNFMVFAVGNAVPPPNNLPLRQFKLDSQGDLIWEKEILFQVPGGISSVFQVNDGFIGSSLNTNNNPLDAYSTYLLKLDFEGNIIWENEVNFYIGTGTDFTTSLLPTVDNGIIGLSLISSNGGHAAYAFKTNSLGYIYRNQIIGNIARDAQPNCVVDSLETRLSGWVISAENSSHTFYGVTDTTGKYQIQIDTGDYVLSVHPPNLIWETCENDIDISVDNTPITEQNFPMEPVVDCPLLVVSSNLFAARPCFDNNQYAVSYCNEGTVTANNAYIEIEVEDDLTYVSSSINLTSQNGNIYTFNLGDIASGECGSFKVYFMVDCEATLGASTCITSHIYPDSFCVVDPSWGGAFVEIDVECNNDQVNFYLANVGTTDMPTTKDYIVVEDAILIMMNNFQLLSGQIDSFSIPANGSTFTLLAEQVENAPGNPLLSAWVEACGTNGSGSFSLGYINQFSLGDDVAYLDTDCRVISSSFDPNDKQGFPLGYSDDHIIRPNTDIEYKIRFQNTGTDTAFTVVIRDTLASELNIPSIHAGSSSHPYSWRIYGENILEFTFNSIMLPDSNVNEAASHGFVEFKISQKQDLPLGSVIRNKAAIYFDFNDPIITNETFHTLGLNFITVSLQNPIQEENRIHVYPNPLQDFAIFEMNKEIKNGVIKFYDLSGKLILEQKVSGKQFELKRNNLKSGFYFYKISDEGRTINSGKIIVN